MFFNEFSSKKFRIVFNILKLTIKNFRKFLLQNSWEKIFENFYCRIHGKKNSTFFRKIRKNKFLPQRKKGKIPTIFPGKSDMTFL